jgi:hypothetical protein
MLFPIIIGIIAIIAIMLLSRKKKSTTESTFTMNDTIHSIVISQPEIKEETPKMSAKPTKKRAPKKKPIDA